MIENISDLLSLWILMIVPVLVSWRAIHTLLSKRKTKKRQEIGKYYREW